jgi:hypothetical protein
MRLWERPFATALRIPSDNTEGLHQVEPARMAGHRPWSELRDAYMAQPGAAERLEAAQRELDRECHRLRWRLVRAYDRLRAALR